MHPLGFQFLILFLNSVSEFDDFIFSGTKDQILGPLKNNVSVPLNTVLTLADRKGFLFRRSYGISLCGKRDHYGLCTSLWQAFVSFCDE